MKKTIFILAALLYLLSCQNEMYRDPMEEWGSSQAVYISSKPENTVFILEGENKQMKVAEVRFVKKELTEMKVDVEAGTQEDLDIYNKKTNKKYILLPKEMYELPASIVFPEKVTSGFINLKLKNMQFTMDGTYALPIKIKSSGYDVINNQGECIVIFEEKIKTKSLRMNGYQTGTGKVYPDNFKVPQWTMEVMVNRKYYTQANRSICGTNLVQGSSTLDEIFTRFGDVTIDNNQLQIKTASSQIDIPKDMFAAKSDEWYMLSFVYDGTKNYVYVNGRQVASREMRTGSYGLVGFWVGGANELIREFRFYKVARTPKQIEDYVWKMVDPNDENLLVYFPMNGKKYDSETGKISEDESKIWDWSKGAHHMNLPSGASWDDNEGAMFEFPKQN